MIRRIKYDNMLTLFFCFYAVIALSYVNKFYLRSESVVPCFKIQDYELEIENEITSKTENVETSKDKVRNEDSSKDSTKREEKKASGESISGKKAKILPICAVETNEKVVSFSFDDGYNYQNTKKILQIFKKYGNLKTTFFFCGSAIDAELKSAEHEGRQNSIKIAFDDGHEIANHSDSHANFKKLSEDKMRKEIENCNKKIENITSEKPRLFRFPYGSYNASSLKVVENLNMTPIQWNIDTLDWSKKSSCDSICSSICKNYKTENVSCPAPGSIILMHTSGKYTPEALEIIIPILQQKGYKIVSISELISRKY